MCGRSHRNKENKRKGKKVNYMGNVKKKKGIFSVFNIGIKRVFIAASKTFLRLFTQTHFS